MKITNKGTHRENCLCFSCERFKNDTPEKCQKADELYQLCCKHNMVTPVYECPDFQEIKVSPTGE